MKQLLEELDIILDIIEDSIDEAVNSADKKVAKELKTLLKKKTGFSPSVRVRGLQIVVYFNESKGHSMPQSIIDIVKSVANPHAVIGGHGGKFVFTSQWAEAMPLIEKLPNVKAVKSSRAKRTKVPKGKELYKVMQGIVKSHSMGDIDGVHVDVQTANVILKVADALKPENRKKFLDTPVRKMASIAWKLVK